MPRFMTSAATPPDAVVRQAIAWWARLQSGIVDAGEREACQAWLAQDPAHRKAWERLETIGRDARRVPAALAHTALDGPATPDRRVALRNLLTLAGVGVAGWAGYRHAPWQRLAADVSTGIGERRAVAVADGLHVTLNSDSALRLASGARGIHLLRGEILVSAQARPGAAPVRVDTGHGVLLADNARFDVRRTPRGAQLGVYEGSVALLRDGASTQAAEAGERLSYDDLGGVERQAADPDRLAWVDGLVVAKDWRLDHFADYLARQRVGVIRVDPAVAGLRLSGVFPLDDAERALRALVPALPIVVTRHTQYWLQVGPRAA